MRLAEYEARARRPTRPAFSQVRAVEVGFEPTEDLRLHTLSSTAHHRSPPSASVRTSADVGRADAGERPRTGVNETKTETTGWHARVPRFGAAPSERRGRLYRRPEPGCPWS